MRTKSNANLYLYTFLSLLFLVASTVDLDTMTSNAMAHQDAREKAALTRLDL